jgi:hypothetical protein
VNEDNDAVGSVAEEAAKLLGALQDWASESGPESATAAAGAASAFNSINEHIATEGEDCKYCPVCQLISVARRTSPEVKHHLGTAASSLLRAAAAAMTTSPSDRAPHSPVEKIHLEDGEDSHKVPSDPS